MRLIFATNNVNKIKEIGSSIGNNIKVIGLKDAGIFQEIPEPHDTLEANASEKSATIYRLTQENCFSEDTGLEVAALNGEPGVKSARYTAGEPQYADPIEKLLAKLKGVTNRSAQFRTIISLIINNKEILFEGKCAGRIIEERRGTNGFGYDPVFIPDEADKTFGEMTLDEKKQYSHRARAVAELAAWFTQNCDNCQP
ncbi:MAG: RdgB/HAM1 family non-canonical purine NTP pyrophosphatase [Niabella sp.]